MGIISAHWGPIICGLCQHFVKKHPQLDSIFCHCGSPGLEAGELWVPTQDRRLGRPCSGWRFSIRGPHGNRWASWGTLVFALHVSLFKGATSFPFLWRSLQAVSASWWHLLQDRVWQGRLSLWLLGRLTPNQKPPRRICVLAAGSSKWPPPTLFSNVLQGDKTVTSTPAGLSCT